MSAERKSSPANEASGQTHEPSPEPVLPIVAIGASAGGLEALQDFFSKVPTDSGIGFVVVTHLRPAGKA